MRYIFQHIFIVFYYLYDNVLELDISSDNPSRPLKPNVLLTYVGNMDIHSILTALEKKINLKSVRK